MRPLTDVELCGRAQEGDRSAANEIQARHGRLVTHLITSHHFPNTLAVEQAGRIGLHNATLAFRPARVRTPKNAFTNYAARLIRQEMGKACRHDRQGLAGLVVNTGRAGKKAWPKRRDGAALANVAGCGVPSLDLLSPLPRVVCRLLLAGLDPVERLGLYPGELDVIRDRAFAEVA